jgi:hypothetical protein
MPQNTKAELQYKAALGVKVIDSAASVIRTGSKCATLVLACYFADDALKALAGKVTLANIVVKVFSTMAINQWVAWVLAGGCATWASLERRQKRKKIAELSARPIELETIIDPKRSSSMITPAGTTKPGD